MSGPFGSTAWMANPASGFYGFEISNSLRQNAGDSAYLHKSQGSGNRRTFTISFWVKRSRLNDRQAIFSASADGNNECFIWFDTNDELFVKENTSGSTNFEIRTNRKFRDANAWYHIVVAYDTTDSTAGDRVKIYVNGVEETSFANETQPDENFQTKFNDGSTTLNIGRMNYNSEYFGGYLAEATLIDGLQLTPASFGELKNDIWIPKDTSGLTFGTNGLRLQFKQSGTGTASASTIGADTSSNTNHLTSVNLVASDVVPDSPTNNWCVINELEARASYGMPTLSEGNLKYSNAGISTSWGFRTTSFVLTSGKWWGECRVSGNTSAMVGIFNIGGSTGLSLFGTQNPMNNTGSFQLFMDVNTTKFRTASSDASVAFTDFNEGDVVGLALDVDNETCKWYVNGSIQGNIGTKDVSISGNEKRYVMTAGMSDSTASTFVWNFGQDSTFAGEETAAANQDENALGNFHHAVPSGYLSICSANLPDPIETLDPAKGGSPQDYFNTVLYTGNATQKDITGVGFQPDWTWIKQRSGTFSHVLGDSVRGDNKFFSSNGTGAEETDDSKFRTFVSDGFQVGTHNGVNQNNETYASWNWKAGTSFSNDASSTSVGSIDSTGSVNTDVGFSIINFTGTGSIQTVAHGLSKAPEIIFEKSRERNDSWIVYSEPLGNTKGLIFNGTNAEIDSDTYWNDTSPTSTVWTMGTQNSVNVSGEETIAYCFHSVENYSKIGSYTGNGNADGTFVYTGFRPAFVIFKRTNATGSWRIMDNKRDTFNVADARLLVDTSGAETTDRDILDMVSNGFKFRRADAGNNGSGDTYIYIAFAEQPFKYANAR